MLSVANIDFSLGSAVRLDALTDRGTLTTLPPLVKTAELFSLGESSGVLAPGAEATIVAFGGKTRALGTVMELSVWRRGGAPSFSGAEATSYVRAARWEHIMSGPWEEEAYSPRMDVEGASTAAAAHLESGDLLRLACEYAVRRPSVIGGYDRDDEICQATLLVYPATALLQGRVVSAAPPPPELLPAVVGEGWLTQHTMTYLAGAAAG